MKRYIGLVLFIAGVFGVGYSLYLMKEISDTRKKFETLEEPFAGNFIEHGIRTHSEQEFKKYDFQAIILLSGSIALVVVGSSLVFFCRRK